MENFKSRKQNGLVCVVVPVHSATPSYFELISFRQCFKILGDHPIYVLAPAGLDMAVYKKEVEGLEIIFIKKKWFENVPSYNKLKTSRFFYRLFEDYDYILTYELDAFVFRNDLEQWCNRQLDYIGAPWFDGMDKATPESAIVGVGNSGFSLRNARTIRKVLKEIHYKSPKLYRSGYKRYIFARLTEPFKHFISGFGENYFVQRDFILFEDRFFSQVVPAYYADFKVGEIEDAVRFSFEVNPRVLFDMNNGKLPFGCHAWWRYDLEFWRPHIEAFGYNLSGSN